MQFFSLFLNSLLAQETATAKLDAKPDATHIRGHALLGPIAQCELLANNQ
jgi:hypothetical protein